MNADATLKFQLRRAAVAVGLAALTLTSSLIVPAQPANAAVAVGVVVGPRRGPPPLRHEVRPARPHRGWYWQPGYWAWRDNDYVWVGGAWVEPPRRGAVWVGGHWVHRHHQWVWVEGHWR